jgi:hypothetical protein
MQFQARPAERGVIFDVSIPAEDYDLFTDIACQVLRPDSSAVFNSAFDYRTKTVPVSFTNAESEDTTGSSNSDPATTKYTLYIRGGLALPDRPHPWHLRIVERRYLQSQPYLSATPSMISLRPFQSEELELHSDKEAPLTPAGYRLFGNLELRKTELETTSVPVKW